MKAAKPNRNKTQPSSPVKEQKLAVKQDKGSRLLFMSILFGIAFLIYGQSVKFEFAMDDNIMIKLNKSVQKGTSGIGDLFTQSMVYGSNGKNDGAYRPLTMISFAIDKQLFGNNPYPFHFINVLLYGLTGIVLFLLLLRIFPAWHSMYPFLITLIFMVHPVHTEVVANIKSRDEILSFLFAMLALFVVFKPGQIHVKNLLVCFFFFLCACLSKETPLCFVIVAPLSLYYFTKRNKQEIFIYSIPFVAGAAIYMLLRTTFLNSMGSGSQISIIDNTLMAASSASEKYATILFITWKYLSLLFFPHPLSWDYSFRQIPISNFTEWRSILPLILFLAMGFFAVITLKSKNIFGWCIILFFTTLFLVSNIAIPIAATMAERFLYFPSLAFAAAFVYALIKIFKVNTSMYSFGKNNLITVSCLLVMMAFSIKAFSRTGDWKNNLALFESGVKSAPNSSRTHSSLAYEYAVQAEQSKNQKDQYMFYNKSIEEFKTALAIFDGNKDGWYNIAHTYDIMGDMENAEKYYKKTIEVDPKSANAYNNLGAVYLRKKRYTEAKALLQKAISINKNYADPLGNMGAAFHFEGNYPEAIRYYELALRVNPNLQTALGNLEKAKKSLAEQNMLSGRK